MPASTSDPSASRTAYRDETGAVLRQRLAVAMGLFALFMGLGTFFEVAYYPERMRPALLLYSLEAGIAGAFGLAFVMAVALAVVARRIPDARHTA